MSWREALTARREEVSARRIAVGFDGFVDTIARPLRQAELPFATIREFGEYLVSKAEQSCSVELAVEARRAGGNMPCLSRAAASLGLQVSCVGMLGEGGVDPVFRDLPCTLYPFAAPGQSTCLEFQDGKVMLSADCALSAPAWDLARQATGGKADALFREADLLALVNWSELSFAHGLWEQVLAVLSEDAPRRERYAVFDLCDVSRRPAEELEAVLRLLGRFAACRTVLLSLNENEARVTSERLLGGMTDLTDIAAALRGRYGLDEVLIHTLRESILMTPRGTTCRATHFVEKPRISTGAGDNFNAASCLGAALGLSDEERVELANAYVHGYVSGGHSMSLTELLQ